MEGLSTDSHHIHQMWRGLMTAGRPRESTAPTVSLYIGSKSPWPWESQYRGWTTTRLTAVDTEDHRNKTWTLSHLCSTSPPTIHNCPAQLEKMNMAGQQWEGVWGGAYERPKSPSPITSIKLKGWYKGHNGPFHTSHNAPSSWTSECLCCVRLPTQKGLCSRSNLSSSVAKLLWSRLFCAINVSLMGSMFDNRTRPVSDYRGHHRSTAHRAKEWPAPQPITTGLRAETGCGRGRSVSEPSPHIPCSFQPQQKRRFPEKQTECWLGRSLRFGF